MPFGFIDGAAGSSPEDLFRGLPPVSKALIVGMVGTMLCATLGVFSGAQYALTWPLVWKNFHVWRLVTCGVFPGMPSFPTLILIFSIGMYSIRYEKNGFSMGGGGGSADYAYMLIFGYVVMETIMLLLFYQPLIIITEGVLFYIMYIWSRKNPGMSVNLWGIGVTAVYIPWVMISIKVLIGASIFLPLLGIAVGHMFYFLVDVLPDLHNIDLLQTPQFLINTLGWGSDNSGVSMDRPNMPAPGAVQPPRDIPRTGRPGGGWGGGRTLGSS